MFEKVIIRGGAEKLLVSPAQAGAPVFPNILGAVVPSVTLVNLSTMDPSLQNASSIQGSVEVEQQIGATASVSVGFEHLTGRDLIMSINQNVPTCVAAGGNNGCRPVSAYANNSQYTAAGHSDYNALHVSLVQRPAHWGSYRVSYAYSKSMNPWTLSAATSLTGTRIPTRNGL